MHFSLSTSVKCTHIFRLERYVLLKCRIFFYVIKDVIGSVVYSIFQRFILTFYYLNIFYDGSKFYTCSAQALKYFTSNCVWDQKVMLGHLVHYVTTSLKLLICDHIYYYPSSRLISLAKFPKHYKNILLKHLIVVHLLFQCLLFASLILFTIYSMILILVIGTYIIWKIVNLHLFYLHQQRQH